MTSDAQRAANRRNGLAAGGPVTIAGKERSRLNRLRHGLAASAVIVLCPTRMQTHSSSSARRSIAILRRRTPCKSNSSNAPPCCSGA